MLKKLLCGLAVAVFAFLPQAVQAQRTNRLASPSPFVAVTPNEMQRSIDLLGLRLGMTLAQVQSIIGSQGGEVFWSGSTDPSYTQSRERLQNGSNSYFAYQAHSIPRSAYQVPGKKGQSRRRPDLGNNLKVKMAFYPIADGDYKAPSNLVLYYMTTSLGFQADKVAIMQGRAEIVPIAADSYYIAAMFGGYYLKHIEQGTFIYVQGAGVNMATGDLTLPMQQWTLQRQREQVCVKLMTEASTLAKRAGTIHPMMVAYDPVTAAAKKTFVAYKELIARRRQKLTYDQLDACGAVSLTIMKTMSSPGILKGEVLNSVTVQHTSAQAIAAAHEGFFNALHR